MFLIIVIAGFITGIYAFFIEPFRLIVKHEKLYLPNWSSEHNGLKIALISDFHLGGWGTDLNKLKKIVAKTNKETPDFIFITGDFDALRIREKGYKTEEISDITKNFKAKYGIYAVLGNHDEYPHFERKILTNSGIKLLEDEIGFQVFERSGIDNEIMEDFDWKYDEVVKDASDDEDSEAEPYVQATNIPGIKKIDIRTPDIVIKVNPERTDLIETQLIDGKECLVITVDDRVEINGMNVHTMSKSELKR